MLQTRYEEYSSFDGNMPFTLLIDMNISKKTHNYVANWHDNLELQLCRDGVGTVMLDEKFITFEKNDIVVINSNVLHHTNAPDMLKCTCLIIDTQFCRQMNIDPVSIRFSEKIKSDALLTLFDELTQIYLGDDVCRTAKMNSAVLKMLIELRENHTVSENTLEIKKHSFEVVKNTIKFIRTNYENKLSLDIIAKNAFMDKYTLSRIFKKATGQTIIQYLGSYRCKKAADLISDGITVSDAATMCGFTNMSFFTRTFKQYMGALPSKYKSK